MKNICKNVKEYIENMNYEFEIKGKPLSEIFPEKTFVRDASGFKKPVKGIILQYGEMIIEV